MRDVSGDGFAAVKVLHVSEAFGGGIQGAISELVDCTPDVEHHLLVAARTKHDLGRDAVLSVKSIRSFVKKTEMVRELYSINSRIRPDVIHLHSMWAGLVGRSCLPWIYRKTGHVAATVYSPHSFAFEQTQYPRPVRIVAKWMERLLCSRQSLLIAVSPFEALIAFDWGYAVSVVPNRVSHRSPTRREADRGVGARRVVTVGRISPQKDPQFFLNAIDQLRAEFEDAFPAEQLEVVWVGDGPAHDRALLERSGVTVTGWMDRTAVRKVVESSDVYLHCAAWEGSPLAVWEALADGVPTVVRSIPSSISLGFRSDLREPSDVARAVIEALSGMPTCGPRMASSSEQADALRWAYRRATRLDSGAR